MSTITAAMVKELRERTGAPMMECKKALTEADGDIDIAIENMRKAGQKLADKKAGRIAAEGVISIATSSDGKKAAIVEVNCETDFVAKDEQFRTFADHVAYTALTGPEELTAAEAVEEQRRELITKIGENINIRRVVVLVTTDTIGSYVHGGRIGVLVRVSGDSSFVSCEEVAHDIAMHIAASNPLALNKKEVPAAHLEKEREIMLAQIADSGKPPEIREKMIAGKLNKYLKEITLLGQPFVKNPSITVEEFLKDNRTEVLDFVRFEVGEGMEKKADNFVEDVMKQVQDNE